MHSRGCMGIHEHAHTNAPHARLMTYAYTHAHARTPWSGDRTVTHTHTRTHTRARTHARTYSQRSAHSCTQLHRYSEAFWEVELHSPIGVVIDDGPIRVARPHTQNTRGCARASVRRYAPAHSDRPSPGTYQARPAVPTYAFAAMARSHLGAAACRSNGHCQPMLRCVAPTRWSRYAAQRRRVCHGLRWWGGRVRD